MQVTLEIEGIAFIIVGLIFFIYGKLFSRRFRRQIEREQNKEVMEMDVPGFLSLLSDQIDKTNLTTAIMNIIESPVAVSNTIAKAIKEIYIKVFRPGRIEEIKDITDVVYYATVRRYPTSALIGLLYATVKMANVMGKEVLGIMKNMEELSYSIVKFLINIRRSMASTLNLIKVTTTLLIPIFNAVGVVLFTVLQAKLSSINQTLGMVSGFGMTGSSSSSFAFGMKPLNLPPTWFAVILALNTIVISYFMTKISTEVFGEQQRYTTRAKAMTNVGQNLIFYGLMLIGASKMFIGLM